LNRRRFTCAVLIRSIPHRRQNPAWNIRQGYDLAQHSQLLTRPRHPKYNATSLILSQRTTALAKNSLHPLRPIATHSRQYYSHRGRVKDLGDRTHHDVHRRDVQNISRQHRKTNSNLGDIAPPNREMLSRRSNIDVATLNEFAICRLMYLQCAESVQSLGKGPSGMCCTIMIGTERLPGRAERTSCKAFGPPVEVPIAMIDGT